MQLGLVRYASAVVRSWKVDAASRQAQAAGSKACAGITEFHGGTSASRDQRRPKQHEGERETQRNRKSMKRGGCAHAVGRNRHSPPAGSVGVAHFTRPHAAPPSEGLTTATSSLPWQLQPAAEMTTSVCAWRLSDCRQGCTQSQSRRLISILGFLASLVYYNYPKKSHYLYTISLVAQGYEVTCFVAGPGEILAPENLQLSGLGSRGTGSRSAD